MNSDLYELIDFEAGWRMPIRVRWVNIANAECTFAEVPLLKIQRAAIEAKLTASATHRSGDNWYIPVLTLKDIASKAEDGTDPESLVRWHPPEPDLAVDADFIHSYCQRKSTPMLLKDEEVAKIIWTSFQEFILHWLVTEGRPLNLFFGRLDAFPLRANWKAAILGGLFDRRNGNYRARTYHARYLEADYSFFRRCITQNPEMLTAYDTDTQTLRWSMEFTPNKKFRNTAQDQEEKRKQKASWNSNYLGQICHAIRDPKLLDRLYEIIVAHSKETDLPAAVFPDGTSHRYPPKGFYPTQTTTVWYQTHLVTRQAILARLQRETPAVEPADAGVQPVPHIQPPAQDVRDAGSPVDAAGEGQA